MALVTTFATTPILRWVYPDHELSRDQIGETSKDTLTQPAPFTIMMCVSDRTVGPGLVKVAAALLGKREERSRLFALHLWNPSDRPSVELRRSGESDRGDESPLTPLLEQAQSLQLDVQPVSFVSADPAEDICRTAQSQQTSLILLGAHKPLWFEGQLSGIVNDVVTQANTPVGVLVNRGLRKIERVLVAYVGGAEELDVLRVAQRLGQTPGVELTILRIHPLGKAKLHNSGDAQPQEATDPLFTQAKLDLQSLRLLTVEHRFPPEAVLAEAQHGYDLVILGMNARWGIEAGMLSPKRRRVLVDSPVSILAIHPPLTESTQSGDSPV